MLTRATLKEGAPAREGGAEGRGPAGCLGGRRDEVPRMGAPRELPVRTTPTARKMGVAVTTSKSGRNWANDW